MTPKHWLNQWKGAVYSDKQIHMYFDTIVSFLMQSRQVVEGRGITVSRHVNYLYFSLSCHVVLHHDKKGWHVMNRKYAKPLLR